LKIKPDKRHTLPIKVFFFLFFVFLYNTLFLSCNFINVETNRGWDNLPQILEKVVPPTFPDKIFLITNYGAIGDGKTDCTQAFHKAIQECNTSGGGKVTVPPGIFLTGAIHLKSNVDLHVQANATILFYREPEKYLPLVYTRFEGVECMNYSPFIYAYGQENIAITGKGTLDGQAGNENWWAWKGREEYGWDSSEPNGNQDIVRLYQMSEDGIPVEQRIFGEGSYLRPNFIQLYRCKNILIEGVNIKRSPMWAVHPVLCDNVSIQNVVILSHGPNNDGCNPESSKNVLIKDCLLDTGDDCIAIKSGRNSDGRRVNVPSENIIIQGCTMRDGHSGVAIGSETSGNVRNIFVENCLMDSPNLERALRIKTNSVRGGTVENIYFRNVTVGEVRDAVIRVNFNYGERDAGQYTPIVRNIFIENVTSKKSEYAVSIAGYERSPVSNLNLYACRFNGVEKGNELLHYKDLSMKEVYINGQPQ
jgi:polygalacturonase